MRLESAEIGCQNISSRLRLCNGVGLSNVHERLRVCQEDYGLRIKSEINKGTSVYVRIPVEASMADVAAR